MTDVTLRKVAKDNYEAVCDLDVAPDQKNFVSSNGWSLVESHYHPHYETRAIYAGDAPVGFFMWVPDADDGSQARSVSIWRFMIDKDQQGKGYGRRALELAISEIAASPRVEEIRIGYDPQNKRAKEMYARFGFTEIGMDEDDDDMIALLSVREP